MFIVESLENAEKHLEENKNFTEFYHLQVIIVFPLRLYHWMLFSVVKYSSETYVFRKLHDRPFFIYFFLHGHF